MDQSAPVEPRCPMTFFGRGLHYQMPQTEEAAKWFDEEWQKWESAHPDDATGEQAYADFVEQQKAWESTKEETERLKRDERERLEQDAVQSIELLDDPESLPNKLFPLVESNKKGGDAPVSDSSGTTIEAATKVQPSVAATKPKPKTGGPKPLMACGHRETYLISSDEGTAYCGECERIATLRSIEQRLLDAKDEELRLASLQPKSPLVNPASIIEPIEYFFENDGTKHQVRLSINKSVYDLFYKNCRRQGRSMSSLVEQFMVKINKSFEVKK